MSRIALISTGGTIEKTYEELGGTLRNRVSVLDVMLAQLDLRGISGITRVPLMNKDSLEMTSEDHARIADEVERWSRDHDGVVVVHGTDRLSQSGEATLTRLRAADGPRVPVVFTGAMRPFELRRTDATQNLTEALLAVQVLAPGVYVSMHNRVLAFPGVRKDPVTRTFVK
jgi:L-asparaginase